MTYREIEIEYAGSFPTHGQFQKKFDIELGIPDYVKKVNVIFNGKTYENLTLGQEGAGKGRIYFPNNGIEFVNNNEELKGGEKLLIQVGWDENLESENDSFKILKVSHGTQFFSIDDHNLMLANNLVSVHPDTKPKGQSSISQFEIFIEAEKGDLFFICRSNESVDLIGMFKDERPLYSLMESHYDEWIDREYITLFTATDKTNFEKSNEKWWLPGNNSTCNEIKPNEFKIFEQKILLPAFGKTLVELETKRKEELGKLKLSIEAVGTLQQKFKNYFENEQSVFNDLNSLSRIERLKINYDYGTKKNIESLPIVWLRKKIIEHLVESTNSLDKSILENIKKEIATHFTKNVFHAWSSSFRLLYPLLYAEHKENVTQTMSNLMESFQKDLGLKTITKIKDVHLDGPQNQGYDRIWYAIYNNTHKTQKTAKQLFFEINKGFKYGLLFHQNSSVNNLTISQTFNYQDVLDYYKPFVNDIINDDVSKYNDMMNLKELLEYKKQIILQGPPGTGKTYTAKDLAEFVVSGEVNSVKEEQAIYIDSSAQIEIIQFHPAYTYEDFIRGIVTEPIGDKINYTPKDKLFLELVNKAIDDVDKKPYVLIIDEINRANLSSVLGELIYALEYRGQNFKSMYADKKGKFELKIPDNLFIIGTMNTADRSVGHIDYALRRRFAFYDVLPTRIESDEFELELFEKVSKLFVKEIKSSVSELEASEHLSLEFQDRPQDIWLGHSYFFKKANIDFKLRIQYEIVPILHEYVKDGILNNTEEVKNILKEISRYSPKNGNTEN
jgi:Cdc6-like AAA superfamily ATPase